MVSYCHALPGYCGVIKGAGAADPGTWPECFVYCDVMMTPQYEMGNARNYQGFGSSAAGRLLWRVAVYCGA